MQNYSQRVTCDMPGTCLMFVLFAYSYTACLMVDSFAVMDGSGAKTVTAVALSFVMDIYLQIASCK